MGGFVAREFARRAQHLELDAFFERVMQLLDARRHFGLGAAIDDGDDRRRGALAVRAASIAVLPPPMTMTFLSFTSGSGVS